MISNNFEQVKKLFEGKKVVVLGSAPSVLDNKGYMIDEHDIVVRVNNFKIDGYEDKVGKRCDVHYSFYGKSIKTKREYLKKLKIKLHMCKCPDDKCHPTRWHISHNKVYGISFKWIYKSRKDFWVAPVYIPTTSHYMDCFHSLNEHVPTTGFSALWEITQMNPKELYITGFDFFKSKIHNVDEKWKHKNSDDPIKHMPEKEKEMVKGWYKKHNWIKVDKYLRRIFE